MSINAKLSSVFEIITTGKQKNTFNINLEGLYPLISASTANNGIMGYVDNYLYDGQNITISRVGNAGTTFYHEGKISLTDNCFILSKINKKIAKVKYVFYLLKLNEDKKIRSISHGTTRKIINKTDLDNLIIYLPSIEIQNAIISIIEPHEKLFVKYSNLVDISSVENAKKDVDNLISIIEPLDILENKINKLKTVLKKLLINIYDKNCNSHVNLFENNKIYTNKYLNQNLYCDTSCIGELEINFSKMINISLEDKPSRADLSIKNNSIIFSKLLGENKVYCFLNNENIVFSTGFFNIKSNDENNDDLLSFLLSSDFKNQKSMLANGTTMIGINNSDLTKVRCKAPFLNSNIYFTFFNKLNEIENKITLARNKIVNLLIK
ncbi:restriction endonuclease subunit S [Ureaplasma urealyticum]|uniref:Restriction-modification enzyme subunit s3a n=1 Tax=Ureaplasma urealyticum serovar 8 str. ATCC 27618 TaxID=626095 RepID=A0ABP2DNT3_UREUR|nr:restriction endonuclease subunit S [Ureaplasma urealyticum]EDU56754.1 restriction-modification enzyme subunit s3a [Ureaplasma urealyticum serovar 7 str. ATCC 27819]EEH01602.1 restriction-modification enzyme subunit s3a [Ureaplasma urealyticum serovar 8 str. ATCC 27618]